VKNISRGEKKIQITETRLYITGLLYTYHVLYDVFARHIDSLETEQKLESDVKRTRTLQNCVEFLPRSSIHQEEYFLCWDCNGH